MSPPDLEIRPYRPADLVPLVAIFNEAAPSDPTNQTWFARSVLLDPDFSPEGLLVAELGGTPVGCGYAASRPADAPRGFLVFVVVAPGHQRRGVGSALVRALVEHLESRGCRSIGFAGFTPHYLAPGLDEQAYPHGRALLEANGFVATDEAVSMGRSLLGLTIPETVRANRDSLASRGYRVGPPSLGQWAALVGFATRTFSEDWADALRGVLARHFEAVPVVVVEKDDEILGFATHGAYRGVQERFGPIGISETVRGLGIGRLLLYETLVSMRAVGLQNAWFLWTEEDGPAGHLYRQAGFTVIRRFTLWERNR